MEGLDQRLSSDTSADFHTAEQIRKKKCTASKGVAIGDRIWFQHRI